MDVQYIWWRDEARSNSYSTSADWSVERLTAQNATAFTDGNQIIEYKFIIKDKANTNYSNWNDVLKVNWFNFKQADGTQIQVTRPSDFLDLGSLEGGDAGNVTIKLSTNIITNNIATGEDYSYAIKKGDVTVKVGDFDGSGEAVVSGLENDVQYNISVSISDLPEYLGNVVTVATDLALVFAEAIG